MKHGKCMMHGMMGEGMSEAAKAVAVVAPVAHRGIVSRFITHPVVLLGLGVTAGIMLYKSSKQKALEKVD